jgi:hypothetical protein
VATDEGLNAPSNVHGNRVDARGIDHAQQTADSSSVATYFHAWRRRQANSQAAEWLEERTAARLAVVEVPVEIREDVRRAVDTLLEGRDEEVEPALNHLWDLLDGQPDLRERFARLQVVADAIDFVKDRTDPRTSGI